MVAAATRESQSGGKKGDKADRFVTHIGNYDSRMSVLVNCVTPAYVWQIVHSRLRAGIRFQTGGVYTPWRSSDTTARSVKR